MTIVSTLIITLHTRLEKKKRRNKNIIPLNRRENNQKETVTEQESQGLFCCWCLRTIGKFSSVSLVHLSKYSMQQSKKCFKIMQQFVLLYLPKVPYEKLDKRQE